MKLKEVLKTFWNPFPMFLIGTLFGAIIFYVVLMTWFSYFYSFWF